MYDFVFIGDNGQADVLAAEMLMVTKGSYRIPMGFQAYF